MWPSAHECSVCILKTCIGGCGAMRQHAADKRYGGMINTYQRNTVSNIRNHPPLGASPAVALSERQKQAKNTHALSTGPKQPATTPQIHTALPVVHICQHPETRTASSKARRPPSSRTQAHSRPPLPGATITVQPKFHTLLK